MSWFERELGWGVQPTELKHLCGRIGELYAALIVNGQMAPEVNQRGYDVVSVDGERISVKTTARSSITNAHVLFNGNSLEFVDRVMVLWINTEEMQIEVLVNAVKDEILPRLTPMENGKYRLGLNQNAHSRRKFKSSEEGISTVNEVSYKGYMIRELESGTIEIECNGQPVSPVKPALREIASLLNVGLLNGNGNAFNTRQLGTKVIQSILQLDLNTTQPTQSEG